MKADYKNWVPKGMIYGFGAAAAGLAGATVGVGLCGKGQVSSVSSAILGAGALGCGTFAIHDMMEPVRYGDMEKFVQELRAEDYEDVRLIKTTNGMFMNPGEAKLMMLAGSTLLLGRK